MSNFGGIWGRLAGSLVAAGVLGSVCSACGVDGVRESHVSAVAAPKELDQRGTVIVRMPFDERGQAQSEKAELRVLRQSAQQGELVEIKDFNTAEQAWKQAREPQRLQQEGAQTHQLDAGSSELIESTDMAMQPPGYYTWNRGYPPAYYNRGFRWGYGLPGFYFGWNTGRGGFSFGYGPGYNYGYGPGFGYAGGYGGWYGYPIGYGAPYPGWYRPGYGYYYYPRHLGGWHRP